MNTITLTYLFDPLCGWCYGASPALHQFAQQEGVMLHLLPTGLFAGANGRTMDAAFADYAWSNDVRIEKMTGQRFTQHYRTQVLGQVGKRFDSALATLALTAVSLTTPERELDALTQLQEARYVHGLDITDMAVVKTCLRERGLDEAATRVSSEDPELVVRNQERLQQAHNLLKTHRISGVPQLILTDHQGSRLLSGQILFQSPVQVAALLSA